MGAFPWLMEGLLPPQVLFRLQGLQPAGANARLTLEGEAKPSFRWSPRGSFPKLPTGLASKLLQGPGLRLVCPETKKEAGRQALIHPTGVHEAPTCPRTQQPRSWNSQTLPCGTKLIPSLPPSLCAKVTFSGGLPPALLCLPCPALMSISVLITFYCWRIGLSAGYCHWSFPSAQSRACP